MFSDVVVVVEVEVEVGGVEEVGGFEIRMFDGLISLCMIPLE